ncbi:NAD-dependent epimerase/dehydratase family protein [Paenibacillus sp. GCM10027628]|uniref:NAD-dependent epimerase/dehydratase family protein n=1 Tax=Paenibacillus sp. GCM10027628 TaxID=3273413 RepID=UPI00362A6E4F
MNTNAEKGTILITGANGFTGKHACAYFTASGMKVIAVVRNKNSSSVQADQVEECDLTNRVQVLQLIQRTMPSYVLHLAGRNSVQDSWDDPIAHMDMNMMATLYLLDVLRNVPECRIVIAGSMLSFAPSDNPRPSHPYSLSKTFQMLAAQSWAHLFCQQIVVARPSNLIGPGHSNGLCGLLAKKAVKVERGLENTPFRLTSLIEERDYLDVRDAVKAYSYLLQFGTSGKVYSVGSGSNRTIQDIVIAFQSTIGWDLPLETGHIEGYVPPQPIELAPMTALGWKPEISFECSIADIIRFYRAEPIIK